MNSNPTAELSAQPGEVYVCLDSPDFPACPATIERRLWNGSRRPWFRRPVTEALVSWLNRQHAAAPEEWPFTAVFDHDALIVFDRGVPESPLHPDHRGRYDLGAGWWVWDLHQPDADPAVPPLLGIVGPPHSDTEVPVVLGRETFSGTAPTFPALLASGFDHQGHVIPRFRREVAEQAIEWWNAVVFNDHADWHRLRFEDDMLVQVYLLPDGAPVPTGLRIAPDTDGRYPLPGRLCHLA
ncbi:hypothetical protein [Amycolatopsis anabasis]|uniref:hypothetical protein n=1 Tax=Amycolatopsis anabasis TaxID=1840409 RepID=UPI00131D5DE0|nr:hypothetical protein [Amycolatopsis anabasis]